MIASYADGSNSTIGRLALANFIAPTGLRQVGSSIHAGKNVGVGSDYTLFSLVDGVVKYEWRTKDKKKVSVYPASAAG